MTEQMQLSRSDMERAQLLGIEPQVQQMVQQPAQSVDTDALNSRIDELDRKMMDVLSSTSETSAIVTRIEDNTNKTLAGLGGITSQISTFQKKTLKGLHEISAKGGGVIDRCAPPRGVVIFLECIILLITLLLSIFSYILSTYYNLSRSTSKIFGTFGRVIPLFGPIIGFLIELVIMSIFIAVGLSSATAATNGLIDAHEVLRTIIEIMYVNVKNVTIKSWETRKLLLSNLEKVVPESLKNDLTLAQNYLNTTISDTKEYYMKEVEKIVTEKTGEIASSAGQKIVENIVDTPRSIVNSASSYIPSLGKVTRTIKSLPTSMFKQLPLAPPPSGGSRNKSGGFSENEYSNQVNVINNLMKLIATNVLGMLDVVTLSVRILGELDETEITKLEKELMSNKNEYEKIMNFDDSSPYAKYLHELSSFTRKTIESSPELTFNSNTQREFMRKSIVDIAQMIPNINMITNKQGGSSKKTKKRLNKRRHKKTKNKKRRHIKTKKSIHKKKNSKKTHKRKNKY